MPVARNYEATKDTVGSRRAIADRATRLRRYHIMTGTGISLNRLNELIRGKRGVTADTAVRLAKLFKTSPFLALWVQRDWRLGLKTGDW